MASSTHSALDVGLGNVLVAGHDQHDSMHHIYKGKTARSWQHLPGEIIRLITTFYLLDVSSSGHCPNSWGIRELWPHRFAYTTFRDALEVERIMHIFPTWKPHIEHHLFWNKACAVIDPSGTFNNLLFIHPTAGSNNSGPIQRISMYRHFRQMMDNSCTVCRINHPYNSEGLCTGSVKRSANSPTLGVVAVCKEHRKQAAYCGVCLREAPRGELEEEYSHGGLVGCAENEDEETWPGVETTCRSCRNEAFWRRVSIRPEWRDAIDSQKWPSLDWETKQSVESFVDMGEGSIRDVLQVGEEKHWLRTYTKLGDMLQQALAASRYTSRAENGEAYGTDEELSDDDLEDPEMLSITEDAGGIRELALNDWARNRILDGHWISPADEWYNYTNHGRLRLAPARHPCPWNRCAIYEGALEDGQGDEAQELEHPRPKTHLAPHPPSYGLCEQTYRAFQRQMREILLPPLRNIVRKIVIECAADGTDPAIRTVRMTTEDVVRELRDESTWYNGIDWLERRTNARLEEERRRVKDDDDSSSSSHSGGSHTTSPVLSTTTLQTTPSPPPSVKDDELAVSSPLAGVPPPMSPVMTMKAPELLRPIPYVPVTTEHMPHYSVEAFTFAWREACAPLYQCQCSICERAMMNVNGAAVPTQAQLAAAAQVQQPPKQPPVEIQIHEVPGVAEEEEEDDFDESEFEGESEHDDDAFISISESPAPTPAYQVTSRKRPSSDLDAESDAPSLSTDADQSERSRTPPKRVRREGSCEYAFSPSATTIPPPSSSPTRQKKRSSEELDDEGTALTPSGKRIRADLVHPRQSLDPLQTTPTAHREKALLVVETQSN